MNHASISVNLTSIRNNLKFIKSKIVDKKTKIMAVVKGDCYGCGVEKIMPILIEEGINDFGVVIVEEGIELRKLGYEENIVILGYVFPETYGVCLDNNLMIGLERLEDAQILNELAKERNIKANVQIRVDTGMGRLGYIPSQKALEEIIEISKLSNIVIEGIHTHFAIGDERNKDYSKMQFERFMNFVNEIEENGVHIPTKHCANSGGTIHWPEVQLDMVRVGSALYGIYPSESMEKDEEVKLHPVMTMKSRVACVKEVAKDEYIGYGNTYKTEEKSIIGVVPIGYVDGIYRSLANIGYVLVNGQKADIVGKICMDQFMINLSGIDAKVGDEILIFGKSDQGEISIDDHARMTGSSTTPSGIINRLGRRIKIDYIG